MKRLNKLMRKVARGPLSGTGTKFFRHRNDRRKMTRQTRNQAALNHAS